MRIEKLVVVIRAGDNPDHKNIAVHGIKTVPQALQLAELLATARGVECDEFVVKAYITCEDPTENDWVTLHREDYGIPF